MSKRFLFTILILSALVIIMVTGACFADSLAWLEKFETYKWYPPQAEAIYEEITQDYPGSDYALEAHKNLIISYRSAKRHDDVQQALDKLVKDFSGHPGLPIALYDIARIYERSRKYEKANNIYQQIIQQCPDSSSADKAQLAGPRIAVLSPIESKNYDGAAAAIDNLLTDFAGHSGLPESLYDIARRYERAKKHDKAKNIYQQIIQQYSGSSAAYRAQLAIKRIDVMLIIGSGEPNAVQAEIDGLIADYGGHQDISETLYDIAEKGYERGRTPESYERAKGLYRQIIDRFPNSSHAARARLLVPKMDILSSIRTGQYEQADVLTKKLVADFAGHSRLPGVLASVASEYERLTHYQRAKDIRQKIAQQYISTDYADSAQVFAEKSRILLLIQQDEHDKALSAVDEFVTKFHERFRQNSSSWPVLWIANQYYREATRARDQGLLTEAQEHFRRAIYVYNKIIKDLPLCRTTPTAYSMTADCYFNLGEYEEAIRYFQEEVENWPSYKDAPQAQYKIACCYEQLHKSGEVTKEEAAKEILAVCTNLLSTYPHCSEALRARSMLENWQTKETHD